MTVDLIVHGPAGSSPPVMAQAFLAGLAECGVDPRPWRTVPRAARPGTDAIEALLARPGDADTVSTCTPIFVQAPLLAGGRPSHDDLTPLARLVTDYCFIAVRADAPWRDARDFVADLRARPSRTAGFGIGSINHLLSLAIARAADTQVDFVTVPTEPDAFASLLAGDVDWVCGVGAEFLHHVEDGRLRAIAVLDDIRHAPFADAMTMAEAGAPVRFCLWRGLMGPPALAMADRRRWWDIADAVRSTRAWRAYLTRNGQHDSFLTGDAFAMFLDEQRGWYREEMVRAGLIAA
ncbi:MAG: tripartite tricarboxylate transporter substrate-binding protein [Rhizobiaceae bacterium]